VDLACTFLFSTLVIATTVKILRDILEILMECTPREIDAAEVEAALLQLDGVQGLHELHIWAVSVGKNVLACHVAAKQGADIKRVSFLSVTFQRPRSRLEHSSHPRGANTGAAACYARPRQTWSLCREAGSKVSRRA
jgi:zinc transporter 2